MTLHEPRWFLSIRSTTELLMANSIATVVWILTVSTDALLLFGVIVTLIFFFRIITEFFARSAMWREKAEFTLLYFWTTSSHRTINDAIRTKAHSMAALRRALSSSELDNTSLRNGRVKGSLLFGERKSTLKPRSPLLKLNSRQFFSIFAKLRDHIDQTHHRLV